MKANEAPEKIYIQSFSVSKEDVKFDKSKMFFDDVWTEEPELGQENIEYTRTDAFIEKALKWYCLDCECNDNCKDTKCFFYREYERCLKGETNALPPKFSDRILNEDGSTSDNWRYRHFTRKIQETFIDKAVVWISNNCYMPHSTLEDFKKYMEGE